MGMPEETEYSDDVDFRSTDNDSLPALFPIAKAVFKEWNLHVNEDKTEFIHFRVAGPTEKMDDGKPLRKNEP